MDRRKFLFSSLISMSGFALIMSKGGLFSTSVSAAAKTNNKDTGTVTVILFDNSGKKLRSAQVPKVIKTDAEWMKQLTADEFQVTRREGTERAYSGQYWDLHDKGIYRCICCDNALFNSDTKFESGTGWPSFWAPIAKQNVRTSSDDSLGVERTAVSCTQCDAHLGHVFPDGPLPTGRRYCMNSVSLKFVKSG
jgi:peptide-methionine (R)-S-oxide reductase